MLHKFLVTVPMTIAAQTEADAKDQAVDIMKRALVGFFYNGADLKAITTDKDGLKNLVSNSVAMTPEQLLDATESMVRKYHEIGRRSSPQPTEEDIWVMLHALNFILWLCPKTGHDAIALMRAKKYA